LQVSTGTNFTITWSPFPPKTREVQLDEKWGFVGQKEEPPDGDESPPRGQNWDHTAIDAESRLLLSLVPGKRTAASCRALLKDVFKRTGGRADLLFTSDEHAPYASAIKKVYGKAGKIPESLCYATVCKKREKGRVVRVVRKLVFGTLSLLGSLLAISRASSTVNTSFVERNNGTDRMQNSRKARKTYGFSKDWDLHNAASFFIGFSYNFCWCVRTLRQKDLDGKCHPRTPAMAAGLADHVWTTREWVTYPVPDG
jgi:IS1 family transposase